MNINRKMSFFLILFFLTGCSGYQFTNPANPLFQFGIDNLTLVQFENQTTLPAVSGVFTNKYFQLLNSYPGLKVSSTLNSKSDAILLGILRSNPKARATEEIIGRQRATDLAPVSTEGRRPFFIPTSKAVRLSLQIILIKNPTSQDLKLARSQFSKFIKRTPKIVLNSTLQVDGNYALEILDGAGTQVNQTINLALRRKMLENLAENAAMQFKETVLDVY